MCEVITKKTPPVKGVGCIFCFAFCVDNNFLCFLFLGKYMIVFFLAFFKNVK